MAQNNKTTCSGQCLSLTVKTVLLILLYFSLSIGLTFYQRKFLQTFHFPLSVVVCHLVIKFLLSSLCRAVWNCYTSKHRVIIDWENYVKKIAGTGITSGLDVGLSNWGLELITVSLYTMTKSTSIIFILGFALLFKLEEKSWKLVIIVGMISGGLFLFTYKATEFDILGFLLVLTASFTSGLRWTLAQLVMQKSKLGLDNPIDMVYHVQPWMIVSVLPFAIGFEGIPLASNCKMFRYEDMHAMVAVLLQIVTGSLIAFFMEVSEYMVVTHTSSLTLSVACIVKEVLTLILAVKMGDHMNMINVVGLLFCMGGILCHILHKASVINKKSSEPEQEDSERVLNNSDARVPLLAESAFFVKSGSINTSDDSDEDSNNVLFNILQRRDNPR